MKYLTTCLEKYDFNKLTDEELDNVVRKLINNLNGLKDKLMELIKYNLKTNKLEFYKNKAHKGCTLSWFKQNKSLKSTKLLGQQKRCCQKFLTAASKQNKVY